MSSNYATRKNRNPHDTLCLAQPCDRKVHARGLCQRHYERDKYSRSISSVQKHHDGLIPTPRGWGSM
jgi:hypothetical protein